MKRKTLFIILILLIPIGLGTRFYRGPFQGWMHQYAGDIFYPMFWYFLLRLLWQSASPSLCGVIILLFCTAVEFSQLLVTPLLQTLRNNFFGAILLGTGFDWPDFIYYTVGVGLAVGLEFFIEH